MTSSKEREFANSAMPINWYEVAKLLHENATQLHAAPQGTVVRSVNGKTYARSTSNRSVFLLAAFALENLIKAFLVYENPHYIEKGKISGALRSHKLSNLQKKCRKIPSPKRTLHVFETLEDGVNSWARYPCSLSIDQETEERIVTPAFWSEYNRVFELYSERLEILMAKNWKGPFGETVSVKFE